MRHLSVFGLALGLFAIATANAASAVETTCTLDELGSADFTISDKGELLIPARIAGKDVNVVFTVGSAQNFIARSAVHPSIPVAEPIPSPRGGTITDAASMGPIDIAHTRFPNSIFLADPAWIVPDASAPFGSIGIATISSVDFELDFAKQKLNLYKQDHCPGRVVYWADSYASLPLRTGKNGEIFLSMDLDGKRIQTALGTATPITSLDRRVAKSLFNIDEHASSVKTDRTNNADRSSIYQFMALKAPGMAIGDAQVYFDDVPGCTKSSLTTQTGADHATGYTDCNNVYPLRLGLNVLKNLHLYFAMKEKVLYFTSVDAAKSAPKAPDVSADAIERAAIPLVTDKTPIPVAQTQVATQTSALEAIPMGDPRNVIAAGDYPPISRRLGEQGVVMIRVLVRADGSVGDVQLVRSSGYPRLDDAAIAVAKTRFHFKPATKNGENVEAPITVGVAFKLT